jgi:hypothetical protein
VNAYHLCPGAIGDCLQVVIVSTGTYGGGTLVSVRGVAR